VPVLLLLLLPMHSALGVSTLMFAKKRPPFHGYTFYSATAAMGGFRHLIPQLKWPARFLSWWQKWKPEWT
jgi:hypothetical protein